MSPASVVHGDMRSSTVQGVQQRDVVYTQHNLAELYLAMGDKDK